MDSTKGLINMTKQELLKALESFKDDTQIVVSFNFADDMKAFLSTKTYDLDSVAFDIVSVGSGWKPSNVADLLITADSNVMN